MKIKRASGQLSLLSVDPMLNASSNAEARNAYGTAAQLIVCESLGLFPIAIDGRYDICFDAELDGIFYEIKSVHKSGKLVVYDWRLEKEMACGVLCFYAIMVHNLRGARSDILNCLRKNIHRIVVVPLDTISSAARKCPLNIPKPCLPDNKRNGYNRKGYCRGYRNIPVSMILKSVSF